MKIDRNTAERLKDALYSQKCNLLVGSGVSLDATDRSSNPLRSAEELRKHLCAIAGVRDSSPLWRVAGYLTEEQIAENLTRPYHGCRAGPTTNAITKLIWKHIFTLNIDDALESAFERDFSRMQMAISVNYTREFEVFRNPQELPIIHIHGFTRHPEDRYVFSMQEYAQVQRGLNPWVNVLSSLIVSEPFIIAGTSLFEPDIEYFFAHRTTRTEVVSRAPSILVEPFPDPGTAKDCARLGLTLVEATLAEFIDWLLMEFGPAPTPLELRAPQTKPRLSGNPTKLSSTAFWNDFEYIVQRESRTNDANAASISAFYFGRQPSWGDIRDNIDVPLQSQLESLDECRRWLASASTRHVVCLQGLAGSGKSTSLKRIVYELANRDLQAFYFKARDGVDIDSATEYLSAVTGPIVLAVDNLAEATEELSLLLKRLPATKRILILAAERQYRINYVRDTLDCESITHLEIKPWRTQERVTLIENYIKKGLIGNASAIASPSRFAKVIDKCIASEAVCRILNDFRPLKTIARSLWSDSHPEGRSAYLAVAITHYCYPQGIRRSVVASAFGDSLVAVLSMPNVPLQIFRHPDDEDFLIPSNGTLATLLVEHIALQHLDDLVDAFIQLGNAISPFVTRSAIRQHTAEARLAGRLFDADGIVNKLLGARGEEFYQQTQEKWQWNSRYWEQRALYVLARDPALSLQHARHAVAIERHPFPMTTLAKILFSLSRDSEAARSALFAEGLALMRDTLEIESRWDRGKTKTAHWVLFDGVIGFLSSGGHLDGNQSRLINRIIQGASDDFGENSDVFRRATEVQEAIARISLNGEAS